MLVGTDRPFDLGISVFCSEWPALSETWIGKSSEARVVCLLVFFVSGSMGPPSRGHHAWVLQISGPSFRFLDLPFESGLL